MGFFRSIKNMFLGVFDKSEQDTEAKRVADIIIADSYEAVDKVHQVYDDLLELMEWMLGMVQKNMGKMPTEEEFLTVVSYIIDKNVTFPTGLNPVSRKFIMFGINILDRHILDRYLGDDWYPRLIVKVNEKQLENKQVIL